MAGVVWTVRCCKQWPRYAPSRIKERGRHLSTAACPNRRPIDRSTTTGPRWRPNGPSARNHIYGLDPRPSFRCFASAIPQPNATEEDELSEVGAVEEIINSDPEGISNRRRGTADEPSVEEQYSRKTPLEHVLLRPGMYIGPNERLPPAPCWVLETTPPIPTRRMDQDSVGDPPLLDDQQQEWSNNNNNNMRMVQRKYGLVPAIIKIFDEILVNASDNRLRHPKSCTRIDVTIDPGSSDDDNFRPPYIRVVNNGKSIPVQIHKKEKMYVPEMLFGHLLTGSNFDDTQKRITGGRHGFGAKLANIFSCEFTVEILDSKHGKRYRQTWRNNMTETSAPEIEEVTKGVDYRNDYTSVSFVPDVARLTGRSKSEGPGGTASTSMAMEDYAAMCRRAVDVAGCLPGLTVTLNGVNVSQPSFADYCQLYRSSDTPVQFEKLNARWTVGVGLSETSTFETISFVNGMATTRGGTHVDVIVQQITKKLKSHIEVLEPELAPYISEAIIRRHLFVCCNALIENPSFDSQMKEYLTSSPELFGSNYKLGKAFFLNLLKSKGDGGPGIVQEIIGYARERQQANLVKKVGGSNKTKRQVLAIPKLDDAHEAGTASGSGCTIILTEGDSAKALAIAGLEVVGRERFGVFPLRGKFLNVRHASVAQLKTNAEVKALCAIIGLDFSKKYKTTHERQKLRYGRVLLMTDQDTDGSHIKGLVLNFFRHFWPALLMPPVDEVKNAEVKDMPFFASFVTPLLKASRKGQNGAALAFYSMPEYNAWQKTLDEEESKKWKTKYYKGLGTSTSAEAKEYFTAFKNNLRPFRWKSNSDGESLDMVFDRERASDRKEWILDKYDHEASLSVDPALGNEVSFEDFVNKELIHFSHADNIRSIPSVVDGLKPSQRKVLFACFKRNLTSEIKVAQLTGYCAEHTAYHHGETSLQSTIIGMAQDFVGSNNINLLEPSGQFGTRLVGGNDAASPRYIFTHLAPVTRLLFPEDDDILLTYLEDDGQSIEPGFYCPVIPLLLVNGCHGIGTGWSTSIPTFDPADILRYIRAKLDKKSVLPPIHPRVRGFEGTFEPMEKGGGYVSVGKVSQKTKTSLLIDELPVQCWTEGYKEKTLLKLREQGSIQGIIENHSVSKVSFTVTVKSESEMEKLKKKGLKKVFNLKRSFGTGNMHAFDADYVLRKFETPEEVIEAYFPVRMALYEDRKSVLESEMSYNAALYRNKARFIQLVIAGEIDLMSGRKSKQETAARLHELDFLTSTMLNAIRNDNALYRRRQQSLSVALDENITDEMNDSDFDYLLSMPFSSLTTERVASLQEAAVEKDQNLRLAKETTASDLWRRDLDRLEPHL